MKRTTSESTTKNNHGGKKAASSVFGPAKVSEGFRDAGERKAHDIEVVAFDARDETAGAALDGVAAGFVVWLAGGEIAGNLPGVEPSKVHERGFDELDALGVGKTDQADPGKDGMIAAREIFKHAARVVGGVGFAENVAVEDHFRVGGDNDSRADGACGNEFCFGVGQALDEDVRRFVGIRSFVNGGGHDVEREAGVAENFGAARRGRREDEFHSESRDFWGGRILLPECGDSLPSKFTFS